MDTSLDHPKHVQGAWGRFRVRACDRLYPPPPELTRFSLREPAEAVRRIRETAEAAGKAFRSSGTQLDGWGQPAYAAYAVFSHDALALRLAVLPGGQVVPLEAAREDLIQRTRADFGSLTISSAQLVTSGRDDPAHHRVLAWFDRSRLSHEELAAIAKELVGGTVIPEVSPPILELADWQSGEGIVEFARTAGVHRVEILEVQTPRAHGVDRDWQIPNQALTTNTHQVFNANGYHGGGQTLGLLDQTGSGCGVLDAHEAFENITDGAVHYTVPVSQCEQDDECEDCDSAGVAGRCVGPDNGMPRNATNPGTCVNVHSTRVLGRASAFSRCGADRIPSSNPIARDPEECFLDIDPTPTTTEVASMNYMASQAKYVYYNEAPPLSASGIASMYDELLNEGVDIVISTYGDSGSSISTREVVGDWYARHRNLTIVQSARNEDMATDFDTGCYGLNTLCVGGFETTDTGTAARDVSTFQMYQFTAWQNPETSDSGVYGAPCTKNAECEPFGECADLVGGGRCRPLAPVLEISKPDVISHADPADVPFVDPAVSDANRYRWTTFAAGNSYSAPVVAAMIAQYRQLCGTTNHLQDRSAVLGAGYRTPFIEDRFAPGSTVALGRAGSGVCTAGSFALGSRNEGRHFMFPNAEATHGCDYAAGVGVLSAAPLAKMCGGIPPPNEPCEGEGCGTDGEPGPEPLDSSDRDGPNFDFFGPEPWLASVPPAEDAVVTRTVETTGPSDGAPLSTTQWAFLIDHDMDDYVDNALALSARTRTLPGTRVIFRNLGSWSFGEFLRVAIAYDGCPGSIASPDDVVGIANNYDFALTGVRVSDGVEEVLFLSESLHDTKEGFMLRMPDDYSSVFLLRLQPDPLRPCPDELGIPVVGEDLSTEIVEWP